MSISGTPGCCVALDEAHEMIINKEVKIAMTSTGMGSLARLLHYLPYRAQLLKILKSELHISDTNDHECESHSFYRLTEGNVTKYLEKLQDADHLFSATDEPDNISHIFTGEVASPTVSSDLKTFYEKGEQDLNAFINCVVLNSSGQKPPKRSRRNIRTFTVKRKQYTNKNRSLKTIGYRLPH